jgi:hypothetical protein
MDISSTLYGASMKHSQLMLYFMVKDWRLAGCQWFMPVILATWEAEIGRIVV